MMHWNRHLIRSKEQVYNFIHHILYDSVSLVMHREQFVLFYPVRYAWLNAEEKAMVIQLMAKRNDVFDRVKTDGDTGDMELSQCKIQLPIGDIERRQLVRDFVLLAVSLKRDVVLSCILFAVQRMLYVDKRKDVFLINLHAALQGRCDITEIPVWGLTPWDIDGEKEYK